MECHLQDSNLRVQCTLELESSSLDRSDKVTFSRHLESNQRPIDDNVILHRNNHYSQSLYQLSYGEIFSQ